MESVAHGIGVKNRYALFYDEDLDPLEILRQQEEEKQKRKVDKTQVKDKSKVSKSSKPPVTTTSPKKPLETAMTKISKVPENVEMVNRSKGKPIPDRYQRSYGTNQESKDFEDRKNTRNKDDQFFSAEHKERDSEFRRGRGGFRGRGGRDRGRGVFGNSENRNRRVFDRHSGSDKTGVRPVDKREGAGSNNWGDIRSDIKERKDDMWEEEFDAGAEKVRETTWVEEEIVEKKDDVGNTAEIDSAEAKENEPLPEEPIEESVKEMTLDEWKREQESQRVVPIYNLRKPGEGEDDKQWKKGYVLKKKAKEEEDDEDEDEEDDEDYNRKGSHRQLLDIPINFYSSDSRRGTRGRGRGGRGAPRSVGPDGGPRGERERGVRGGRGGNREPAKVKGQQSAPRVDDFNDFPSLVNG